MPAQLLGPPETSPTTITLIEHIPTSERKNFLIKLIKSLRSQDATSIKFVASLVASEPDPDIEEDFLAVLEANIQHEFLDSTVGICLQHQHLGYRLLDRAINSIRQAKSFDADVETCLIQSYLVFSRSVVSRLPCSDAHTRVFEICLELLNSGNQDILKNAMDVVFAVLTGLQGSGSQSDMLATRNMVWGSVQGMILSKMQHHVKQGYSLWLRYLVSAPQEAWSPLIGRHYWELLLHGLRHGDTERRKLCLNIIKLSIPADQSIGSDNERLYYERYCTVFETIVLGRYINQIQECENNLNALVETDILSPDWLYVLLASGMDPQMQDSNRKFIGNWIMKSNLDPTTNLVELLQHDFLPWAIQGQLFVSSLKTSNGILRCVHGDALASFIKRLQASRTTALVDTVVKVIHSRSNTIFAYAVVYLLEGLSGNLRPEHLNQVAEVKALPEVARDYLHFTLSQAGGKKQEIHAKSRRETMETAAIDKFRQPVLDIATVDEIWRDLEYLEFPKRLLMIAPTVIFQPKAIKLARDNPKTAADLAEKSLILLKVSSTKVYTFSPLVISIRQSVLGGSDASAVLPIADFIIRICEHPPEPTIDLMLEEATVHLTSCSYEDYFGERPSYGFAALLDLVSRLGKHQNIIETVLDHTLSRWKAQKIPPPTISAWKNTLQLQVLLLCFEQYQPASCSRILELLEDLFHILAIEPLPRYRYLLEAAIVQHIIRHDLHETLVERLSSDDHHGNPKHLASLMKVGTILACRESSSPEFAARLAATFIPLAASSKVVIRHEAQWQIPILLDHCRSERWTAITENPAYAALDRYIRSLERFSDPPLEKRVGSFNPDTDFTMSNLAEGQWFDLDQLEPPLTSYDKFVKLYANDLPSDAPEPCIPLGEKVNRIIPSQNDSKTSKATSEPIIGPRISTESTALQTKGTAYLARTLSDPSTQTKRPHDLVVIGSLVDNPYNLGGLSRVSEIFGAAALTLQNQNVVSNKDFTSVSVSSHLHFPIVQLSASGVPAFLAERKLEGYTVVGIEQTDRSVILGSEACLLPKKVCLVVGSEKEGIPAVVLTECELLVEIPQAGVTRSLNVQTAVGIVLFEYARQHSR